MLAADGTSVRRTAVKITARELAEFILENRVFFAWKSFAAGGRNEMKRGPKKWKERD